MQQGSGAIDPRLFRNPQNIILSTSEIRCATVASKAYGPLVDIVLEVALDLDIYDLSNHLLLEKIETTICSKTSAVPPTYLHHLTSRISSSNFRDLIITTHDHDFHDLASILSTTAEKVAHNLLTQRNGVPDRTGTRTKVTFHIEDPLWSSRDREQLVREISPTILEESEVVAVVQKRNLSWAGACHDQSEMDSIVFIG